MPSENTILNLFRRLFSFFNNSTSHYRLRTRRQKAARFRLPKHIMVEHSQPDGLVSRYEYDSYDPLAQVCNWTSMSTVRRGCITTSSGIMSLMQGGVNQNLIGLDGGGFHEWFPVSMADKLEGVKTKRGAIMRIKSFAEKFTRVGKKSVGGC